MFVKLLNILYKGYIMTESTAAKAEDCSLHADALIYGQIIS